MQRVNDARDPEAAVRPHAPSRHRRRSPHHRPAAFGPRPLRHVLFIAAAGPIATSAGRGGPRRLRVGRIRLRRFRPGLGINDRRPFGIFRRLRNGRRRFRGTRHVDTLRRRRRALRFDPGQRQTPVPAMGGSGSQNEPCNQNEFTHDEVSP